MARRLRSSHAPLPPSTDPRWEKWSAPLLDFLALPRTWGEVNGWMIAAGYDDTLIKNCMAWLENTHKARSFVQHNQHYWAAATARPRRSLPVNEDDVLQAMVRGS